MRASARVRVIHHKFPSLVSPRGSETTVSGAAAVSESRYARFGLLLRGDSNPHVVFYRRGRNVSSARVGSVWGSSGTCAGDDALTGVCQPAAERVAAVASARGARGARGAQVLSPAGWSGVAVTSRRSAPLRPGEPDLRAGGVARVQGIGDTRARGQGPR